MKSSQVVNFNMYNKLGAHAFTDTYQGAGEGEQIILPLRILTLDLRAITQLVHTIENTHLF